MKNRVFECEKCTICPCRLEIIILQDSKGIPKLRCPLSNMPFKSEWKEVDTK